MKMKVTYEINLMIRKIANIVTRRKHTLRLGKYPVAKLDASTTFMVN